MTVVIANDGGWGQIRRRQRGTGGLWGWSWGDRYDLIAETLAAAGPMLKRWRSCSGP